MKPEELLKKAQGSSFYRFLLNRILWRMIPFNSPHRFCVTSVENEAITITVPYIRKNKNHINGLHACALATLSEYISGLSLARVLPADRYRFILQSIHMHYHYQGKMDASARFGISAEELNAIEQQLQSETAVLRTYAVKIHDTAGNHLCTGDITWQIKPWSKVKSAV